MNRHRGEGEDVERVYRRHCWTLTKQNGYEKGGGERGQEKEACGRNK